MTRSPRPWPKRVAAGSAVFIVALGLTVLAGWFSDTPALARVVPQLPPMTRNAAGCFLLCGLAMFMAALGSPRWPVVLCAGIVSAGTLLTILEFAFRMNEGIDELLGPSYFTVKLSSPGRMSPVGAMCFALGSTGMVMAPRILSKRSALLLGLRDLSALIVDDNATNRRLLEEMLLGWRMVPTLAASVRDALTALRVAQASGRPFRLVLTDVQMPDADGFTLAEAIKKDPAIAGTTVVMLTSGGQPGDAARCRELGVAAYLTKPIKRSALCGAVLLALGVQSGEGDRPALVTRHSLREARQTGRILLVEDNSVNQLVARRHLEKRGHTVVVANNGREALAILEESAYVGFGCVLMDVQMPEMDGFECTAIIRERERSTGFRLPIIAMTAHAMKGDDTRCLAAGMDAYVSKPIQPDELFELIDRHLAVSNVPASRATLVLGKR